MLIWDIARCHTNSRKASGNSDRSCGCTSTLMTRAIFAARDATRGNRHVVRGERETEIDLLRAATGPADAGRDSGFEVGGLEREPGSIRPVIS